MVLFILIVALVSPVGGILAETNHGLIWGIETQQIVSYRLIETLTNQTHGRMVVEDVFIYLKADQLPEIPGIITNFSDVPWAWGTMFDLQGANFTPFLSTLGVYPPVFPYSSKQRMAVPIGNWSLMTQLCLEYKLYTQSENSTHWSMYIGLVAMIVTPFEVDEYIPITPITPLPGSVHIKNNWTYLKSDGIFVEAIGSWETCDVLLEYRMFEAELNTTREDTTTSSWSTNTTQIKHIQEIFFAIGTSCGIGLMLAVCLWQKREEMFTVTH